MKRVAAMTLALIMLLAVMAQAAGPAKVPQARTSLTFSGTTANCSVNNSDYLQKARKYGHFTGYKN